MASIRVRGGKYQARVVRQGQPTMAKTFTTKVDAVRWARQTEIDIERGAVDSPGFKAPLWELIDRYVREVTPHKKNHSGERYILRRWQRESFCKSPAASVNPADLAQWRDKRLATGISTGTVRNALAALSAVYRHASLDWGMERLDNPVMRLKRPAPGKARTRRVTEAELFAIKTHTGSADLPPLIDLAVETAMRLSELVNLRWEYVNLRERTVHLPDTKNGDPRSVPLSSTAVATLEALRASPIVRIHGRLFDLTSHAVTVAFRRAVKRARTLHLENLKLRDMTDDGALDNLRFHDLRHEAVSRLFERGLNVLEVGTISGHKTLQMLKRYTHLKATDLVKKLG